MWVKGNLRVSRNKKKKRVSRNHYFIGYSLLENKMDKTKKSYLAKDIN